MPNRIIKETLRVSKKVNAMTDFQFRLWISLITYVDDFGCGSADEDVLKGFLFPKRPAVTAKSIAEGLSQMECIGLINLYEVDGEPYLCFPNWSDHQQIRAKKSKFPQITERDDTCNQLISDDSKCSRNPIQSKYNPNPNPNPNPKRAGAREDRDDAFEEFWQAYPKRKNKGDAEKAWKKEHPDLDRCIEAINRQKCTKQWRENGGQYIPYPATWINRHGWDDEVTEQDCTGENQYSNLQNLMEMFKDQ